MTRGKISGYYVNSILAKREVKADGYDEAIMLDPEGYVAEGTGENVFIVRRGVLKTTPLTSILEGITRNSIIPVSYTHLDVYKRQSSSTCACFPSTHNANLTASEPAGRCPFK